MDKPTENERRGEQAVRLFRHFREGSQPTDGALETFLVHSLPYIFDPGWEKRVAKEHEDGGERAYNTRVATVRSFLRQSSGELLISSPHGACRLVKRDSTGRPHYFFRPLDPKKGLPSKMLELVMGAQEILFTLTGAPLSREEARTLLRAA